MNGRANHQQAVPVGYLFIGGPIDGTVKQVNGHCPIYRVSWLPSPPVAHTDFTRESVLDIHTFTYNLTKLGDEWVYLAEDTSIDEAFRLLIKHYKPNPVDTSLLVSHEMRERHREWLADVFGI